jgi:sugar phosphate isomerase/epimerase
MAGADAMLIGPMGANEVGVCVSTLVGNCYAASADDWRAAGDAALAAGWTSAAVWSRHVLEVASTGLPIDAVEVATAWANGSPVAAAEEEAQRMAEEAASVGARLIGAAVVPPTIDDLGLVQDNLARLVEAAASAGARVAVEFLPWTGLPTLAAAWALAEPTGADLTLDTWHWQRQPGGPALDLLASLPGERIAHVQMSDAAAVPDGEPLDEALSSRLLPGDGVVDFGAVFACLRSIGASPYVATEVFNSGLLASLGAQAMATAMRSSALSQLT